MKGSSSCFLLLFVVACIVCVSSVNRKNPCNNQVPCDNSQCIDREDWCNKVTNCNDASDEKYCAKGRWWDPYPNLCTEKHFECSDGICVPLVIRCDGYSNCIDGSDEEDCDEVSTKSPIGGGDEEERPSTNSVEPGQDISRDAYEISTIETTPSMWTSSIHTTFQSRPTTPTTMSYYDRKISGNFDQRTRNAQHASRQRSHEHPTQSPHGGASINIRLDQRTHGYENRIPQYPNVPTRHHAPDVMRAVYEPRSPQQQSQVPSQLLKFRIRKQILYSPLYIETRSEQYSANRPPISSDPAVALPPFSFRTNYTRDFGYKYMDAVQKAENWILDRRNVSYGWGEDTPRALLALSLINNSFLPNNPENELMKKNFATDLGVELLQLRRRSDKIRESKLSIYINALLATCQDPRNFPGYDLVEMLYSQNNTTNPYVYLTLCLANYPLARNSIWILQSFLNCRSRNEKCRATKILATTALACFHQHEEIKTHLNPIMDEAFRLLKDSRRSDGSFGSIYSTALAAQALMSINNHASWDPEPTLDYLIRHQKEDGSFGDFLATYYILPALSGRSLLHIRNTKCNRTVPVKKAFSPEDLLYFPGPKNNIFYTLKVGNPETSSLPLFLSLPLNTTFFDAMRVAEFISPSFKFLYAEVNGFIDVHTISGLPNDPERNYRWYLYRVHGRTVVDLDLNNPYTEDVRDLILQDKEEIIFWYLNL